MEDDVQLELRREGKDDRVTQEENILCTKYADPES
jgi:hypothetical protein